MLKDNLGQNSFLFSVIADSSQPQKWNLTCSGGTCTYTLLVPAGNVSAINNLLLQVEWAQNDTSKVQIEVGKLRTRVHSESVSNNNTIRALLNLHRNLLEHLNMTNAKLEIAKAKLKMLQSNVTRTNTTVYQFGQNNLCYNSCLDSLTTAAPSPTSPPAPLCYHNGNKTSGYCTCKIGWYGRYCGSIVCLNNARPETDQSKCICQSGTNKNWGEHCGMNGTVWTTTPAPTTPHPCFPNPCLNNGTCATEGGDTYLCTCPGNLDPRYNCNETAAASCPSNGTLVVPGPLLSPGYPMQYSNNLHCVWDLTAPNGSHVWFQIESLKLESGNQQICPGGCCDSLTVYDGRNNTKILQGPLCGTRSIQKIVSSTVGNVLRIEFKTDESMLMHRLEPEYMSRTSCTERDPCSFKAKYGFANETCSNGTICANGGYCIQDVCVCPPLTKGPTCSGKRQPCEIEPYPCLNGGTCHNLNNDTNYHCSCPAPFTGKNCQSAPAYDCSDIYYVLGETKAGVYNIAINGKTVEVYCEEGWTYIQRRMDGKDFNQNWITYKKGFGTVSGSHWLGLDYIYDLTNNNNKTYSLRIELKDCSGLAPSPPEEYATFKIDSAANSYALRVSGGSGGAGNALEDPSPVLKQNGIKFSTKDQDNSIQRHCVATYQSGWWFPYCFSISANLNGVWHSDCNPGQPNHGIQWDTWKGYSYSLLKAAMKIKPQHT